MAKQRACVFAPHALCDVRHTVRARAHALLRCTRKLCALPTMRSCTRAHPQTVPACARPFFVEMRVMANVVGSPTLTELPWTKVEQPTKGSTPGQRRPRSHPLYDVDHPGRRVAIRGRPLRPSADGLSGHPQTTSGHPQADDLQPSDHGPSARRRPLAIRMQTTSGAIRTQKTSGPSASRRPQSHPQASASRRPPAIRKQTTSGHPQTTCGHPQTTSGHPQTTLKKTDLHQWRLTRDADNWRSSEDGRRIKHG